MDRLNKVHRSYRVELPKSLTSVVTAEPPPARLARFTPGVAHMLAIAGFMTCGGIIVATCGLLAFYMQ